MSLVNTFVGNPVKVAVGVLLVALFGAIALDRMPMQLTPEVSTPEITIETSWPGASPQEVEREIVLEQEEQLKGVEGVIKMSSECMDSMGRITLEFNVTQDMQEALVKVNARLQQVREYPDDALEPVLSTTSSAEQPIAWLILRPRLPKDEELRAFIADYPALEEPLGRVTSVTSPGLRAQRLNDVAKKHPEAAILLPAPVDMTTMRRFAEDNVEARFERVPGISNSNVLGGREEELHIVVNPARLADRGVTVGDIRAALNARNVDTSAGDIWDGKRRYVVRVLGQFRSEADVLDVTIVRRENGPVKVRDVADVKLGFKKPTSTVQNFGTTVLAVNCVRERGANVIETMGGIYKAVDELNRGVLAANNLQIDQVYDETDYIHSAVGLVKNNILLGGILTTLVLLIFLRSIRSTLVIALAIPTSIIGTFLMLDLLGRSLNVVSLAGLAFAVGMLVDNAVVVLENIVRRWQSGERRWVAAVKGTQEVWGAVVASTLTTLAVFLPILFVKEEAGQLFGDIALAISCSVGLSLIVSVTVISTASARVLPSREAAEHMKGSFLNRIFAPFDVIGRGFVAGVLAAHRWLSRGVLRQAAVALVLVAAGVGGSWLLVPKTEYLPQGNRNLAIGIVLPPPGLNLDELVEMGEVVEQRLRPYWDLDQDDPKIASLPFPAIHDFFFVARGRSVFLGIRARDAERAGELVPLIYWALGDIPGIIPIANQTSLFERGLAAGRAIDVEITGPRLERLVGYGGRMMGMVPAAVPGARPRPKPSLDLNSPEIHVLPRWDRAAELGIDARRLGYMVNSLIDGAFAGDYYLGGDKIDMAIMGLSGANGSFRERFERLEMLPIATEDGDLVPLAAVADVRLSSGPEQINRRERERAITISVTPPPTTALEDAMDAIRADVVAPLTAEEGYDPAYRFTLAGTADKLTAASKALGFNLFLALMITYLLMAALFESWLFPFIVILSVPLGAVGGFLGLEILNLFVYQALDVLTMLGFVILIGTVVNNAILIVHQSNLHMKDEGMPLTDAVLESVRTRLRPIFMTVTTTVCGLLPLVIFPGAGSELYRGLGSVLIGGLIVSTVFTIFLVPILFRLLVSLRLRVLALLARKPSEGRA